MRKFVNDCDGRMTGDNCVEIELFQSDITVQYPAHRHALKVSDHCCGIFAAMRFHHRHYDVGALALEQMSIFQHLISLADTGGGADVDTQLRLLALFEFSEKRFRCWTV